MSKIVIYIYLITSTLCLRSQDFKQDLMNVMAEQKKLEKQCYSLKYTLRENHNYNSKVLYTSMGKYIKTKNSFLSEIDHITSVTMTDIVIMVDKEQKKIIVSNNSKKEAAQLELLKQLEDYNKNVQKIVSSEIAKDKYLYAVELKKSPSPIIKYEVVIDKKLRSLVRLTLFYKGTLPKDDAYHITGKEVPRLDIEFSDYNDFKVLKETECSKSYYFTQSNNKLTPTDNFRGYDVKKL